MSKMQLLDPIGVSCKLILLQFYDEGTRLRIRENVLELIPPNIVESLLWRRWNGDSREDMSLLFASIVRFVELYLCSNSKSNSEESFQGEKEFDTSDDITLHVTNCLINSDNKEYFKKMANYMVSGIPHLEKVYGLSCAGLTLQLYINLLSAGINGTYNKSMLPSYAKDITDQNLIQPEKLKDVWKSDDIKRMTELFDNCFAVRTSNPIMLNGYLTSITAILNAKDEEFRRIVCSAF